jgi:hypothetical protein
MSREVSVMQHIEDDGLYRAKWAAYEIRLRLRSGWCDADITRATDGKLMAVMPALSRCSATEAIRWAATWLEGHGGSVLVDGRALPLVDFLSFTSDGGA